MNDISNNWTKLNITSVFLTDFNALPFFSHSWWSVAGRGFLGESTFPTLIPSISDQSEASIQVTWSLWTNERLYIPSISESGLGLISPPWSIIVHIIILIIVHIVILITLHIIIIISLLCVIVKLKIQVKGPDTDQDNFRSISSFLILTTQDNAWSFRIQILEWAS